MCCVCVRHAWLVSRRPPAPTPAALAQRLLLSSALHFEQHSANAFLCIDWQPRERRTASSRAHASFPLAALAHIAGVARESTHHMYAPSSLQCSVVPVHYGPSTKPRAGIRRESVDGARDKLGRRRGRGMDVKRSRVAGTATLTRCGALDAVHTRRGAAPGSWLK
jgi:hypothetical protein